MMTAIVDFHNAISGRHDFVPWPSRLDVAHWWLSRVNRWSVCTSIPRGDMKHPRLEPTSPPPPQPWGQSQCPDSPSPDPCLALGSGSNITADKVCFPAPSTGVLVNTLVLWCGGGRAAHTQHHPRTRDAEHPGIWTLSINSQAPPLSSESALKPHLVQTLYGEQLGDLQKDGDML